MASLILLELLTVFSLMYSLLLLFVSFATVEETFFVFVWTIAVLMVSILGSRKSKWWQLTIPLMLLPLSIYNDLTSLVCIISTSFFGCLYVRTSLLKGDQREYVSNLKKTIPLFFLAVYLRSLPSIVYDDPFSGSFSHAAPFLITFFLSAVVLIRSFRHLDSGMEPKKLRQANIKYLGLMFFISIVTAFTGFRNFIWSLIKKLPYLVVYPLYYLFKLFDRLLILLNNVTQGLESGHWLPDQILPGELPGEKLEEIVEEYVTADTVVADTILGVLILAIVGYILYRLFAKAGSRVKYEGLDYIEEREYIKTSRPKRKRPLRDKFPGELGDQIRFYYRRFLDKLTRNKVGILKSDTSLEVNEKAKAVFAAGTDRIRSIYIASRYGEKQADEETVAEMEKLYKGLSRSN